MRYPFKWIQLNGNVKIELCLLKNWTFSPLPFNCKKAGRVQLSSNFFLLLSPISHSRARFEHVFEKIHQKWKYYREEKQDFERFLALLVFLNIEISAKSKKLNSMKSL